MWWSIRLLLAFHLSVLLVANNEKARGGTEDNCSLATGGASSIEMNGQSDYSDTAATSSCMLQVGTGRLSTPRGPPLAKGVLSSRGLFAGTQLLAGTQTRAESKDAVSQDSIVAPLAVVAAEVVNKMKDHIPDVEDELPPELGMEGRSSSRRGPELAVRRARHAWFDHSGVERTFSNVRRNMPADEGSVGRMFLELHLPSTTLRQIYVGTEQSVSGFLGNVHETLVSALNVDPPRIRVLSIVERYRTTQNGGEYVGLESNRTDMTSSNGSNRNATREDEQVVLFISVNPAHSNHSKDVQDVVVDFQGQLHNAGSKLMTGPLKDLFFNATLTPMPENRWGGPLSMEGDNGFVAAYRDPESVKRQAHRMALVLGLSAACTGVVLFLSAF